MIVNTYTKEERKELLKNLLQQGKFLYIQQRETVRCTIYLACADCLFVVRTDKSFSCSIIEESRPDTKSTTIIDEVLREMYPEDFI